MDKSQNILILLLINQVNKTQDTPYATRSYLYSNGYLTQIIMNFHISLCD